MKNRRNHPILAALGPIVALSTLGNSAAWSHSEVPGGPVVVVVRHCWHWLGKVPDCPQQCRAAVAFPPFTFTNCLFKQGHGHPVAPYNRPLGEPQCPCASNPQSCLDVVGQSGGTVTQMSRHHHSLRLRCCRSCCSGAGSG
jgi:hypothetical protein